MKQFNNYADQRANGQCVYCGGNPETREHVPPRVFLDKPYPENLPVVDACKECNNGFSLDEEYFACLLDCVISNSVDPEKIKRNKIKRKMTESPALAKRLSDAYRQDENSFEIEHHRIKDIVGKIATGHILYELNELSRDDLEVNIIPIPCLSETEILEFESLPQPRIWPEVGSRSIQRMILGDDSVSNGWITVQPNRYRYVVLQSDQIEVRMVFSEYLACQVVWK